MKSTHKQENRTDAWALKASLLISDPFNAELLEISDNSCLMVAFPIRMRYNYIKDNDITNFKEIKNGYT